MNYWDRDLANEGTDAKFKSIREARALGDDLYWVSQLFEKQWKPSPTA